MLTMSLKCGVNGIAREHFGNMMFYFPDGFVYFKLPGIVDNCNVISCLTAIWRHSNDARVLNAIGIEKQRRHTLIRIIFARERSDQARWSVATERGSTVGSFFIF